ncbi:NAD-dependent epimerase/dehydratase family protein [Subtercola sp. PAMC28395]|uniref:NAD-dependent epimerase/dehydratase family protein n=1 Tax=Subtercola sp. PAMC28395 TaxID=2846775 RepID=UPI001C0CC0D9|nr:NAD-dependent epimerase/dehydratase family protein [Subtercola sp. PAMC28395]QWT23524.1 NAD-dependent epimerase/dehydratase family protein [Subtercola sp. PAMC28395]
MTVLVTGASGMLGRAVATELIRAGHTVSTFQRGVSGVPGARDVRGSLTDEREVQRAVEGVESIIHLAAKVSMAGRVADFDAVNVQGTRSLLEAARQAGVSRFVMVSSPSVAHAGVAVIGDDALPADPANARGDYARSKAESELLALAADRPGFAVVAVRPHIVWGPGDTQLIERIVERSRQGRLPLLSGGLALIDTTYVDNAATAIVAGLGRAVQVHGESFVVTNGEPRTVRELLAGICAAAGVPAPQWGVPAPLARAAGGAIEHFWGLKARADEPPMTRFLAEQLSTSHWYDQRRTRHSLGWEPAVSLDEGLGRLRDWYAAQ